MLPHGCPVPWDGGEKHSCWAWWVQETAPPPPPHQRRLGNQISAQFCLQVGKYWEQFCPGCPSAVASGHGGGVRAQPLPGLIGGAAAVWTLGKGASPQRTLCLYKKEKSACWGYISLSTLLSAIPGIHAGPPGSKPAQAPDQGCRAGSASEGPEGTSHSPPRAPAGSSPLNAMTCLRNWVLPIPLALALEVLARRSQALPNTLGRSRLGPLTEGRAVRNEGREARPPCPDSTLARPSTQRLLPQLQTHL